MLVPESFELTNIWLRRPRLSDAPSIFEYGSDPEVARFADWPRLTSLEPLLETLSRREILWNEGLEYYWIITLKDSDKAIGAISCRIAENAAEIGYLLNRKYWGRGYATQAARAIVDWALSQAEVSLVWATCDVENVASIRVLERIGMHREKILPNYRIRPQISGQARDAYLYVRISKTGTRKQKQHKI